MRIPVEAPLELRSIVRAHLGDDGERDFLARWTTWRDSRMAVAARVGEQDMDQLWESFREFGGWVCCSQSLGFIHVYSGFSNLSLQNSSLSALGNPGCFHVSTGQWLEPVP